LIVRIGLRGSAARRTSVHGVALCSDTVNVEPMRAMGVRSLTRSDEDRARARLHRAAQPVGEVVAERIVEGGCRERIRETQGAGPTQLFSAAQAGISTARSLQAANERLIEQR